MNNHFNEVTQFLTKLHKRQLAAAKKQAKATPKWNMEVVHFVPLKEALDQKG